MAPSETWNKFTMARTYVGFNRTSGVIPCGYRAGYYDWSIFMIYKHVICNYTFLKYSKSNLTLPIKV